MTIAETEISFIKCLMEQQIQTKKAHLEMKGRSIVPLSQMEMLKAANKRTDSECLLAKKNHYPSSR